MDHAWFNGHVSSSNNIQDKCLIVTDIYTIIVCEKRGGGGGGGQEIQYLTLKLYKKKSLPVA